MVDPLVPGEILEHYQARFDEGRRLSTTGDGILEATRTLELLDRHLPPPPARILDVGGGPGFYARRLTAAGYEVHLVDPVPRHVAAAAEDGPDGPRPVSAALGEARALDHPDGLFDAILLLGPMYHLTERGDRMAALAEAHRALVPGGVVFAAAISRFASAIDGLERSLVDADEFARSMLRDLADGQHRNPGGDPEYFTTAFLHRPDELAAEMAESGFSDVRVLAVEGIGWVAGDLADRLADPPRRDLLLEIVRRTEAEPSLLGASPHLLGIGRR